MQSEASEALATEAKKAPSDAELLDILYELLTDDTGEDHGVSVQTIEAFLHEHARDPQAAGTLAQFFEKHGLSTSLADYGRDPSLASVPSGVHMGVLPLVAHDSVAAPPASEDALHDEPTPARAVAPQPAPQPQPQLQTPTVVKVPARPGWLTPALVTLALMLGLVGAVSAFAALEERDLERELSLSRAQLRATSEAVDSLRGEAKNLKQQLDSQRESEQALSAKLEALEEAERVRQAEIEEQKARRSRWRRPAQRAAAE